MWRVCIGRIPTSIELSKRGINISNPSCRRQCLDGVDDTDHNFAVCPFARGVLSRIWNWCNISDPPDFNSVNDIISYAANWGHCPKKRKVLIAIIYGYVWSMWRMRNDRIFNDICGSISKVADNVLSLVYDWVKYRGNFVNLNWVIWCCNPLNIV